MVDETKQHPLFQERERMIMIIALLNFVNAMQVSYDLSGFQLHQVSSDRLYKFSISDKIFKKSHRYV
jgi:hypothetical protein